MANERREWRVLKPKPVAETPQMWTSSRWLIGVTWL